jgi:hypothetical protein
MGKGPQNTNMHSPGARPNNAEPPRMSVVLHEVR